jgi:hypothetical protein
VTQGVGPEFKPQYCKKKKKEQHKIKAAGFRKVLLMNLDFDTHARSTRKKKSNAEAMALYTTPWTSPLRNTLESEFLSATRGRREWFSS